MVNNVSLTPHELLTQWLIRAADRERVNFTAANIYKTWHLVIGLPILALTTIAASSSFSSWEKLPGRYSIAISCFKILVPVLAALQTFLGLSELAERHRRMATKYGALKRQLEQRLTQLPLEPAELEKLMSTIRTEIDAIEDDEPQIPRFVWIRTWFKRQP